MSKLNTTVEQLSNDLILRVRFAKTVGIIGVISAEIAKLGGQITAIDLVQTDKEGSIRDLSIICESLESTKKIIQMLEESTKVELIRYSDRTFLSHIGGKIEIANRIPVNNREDLSIAYTPGVAKICTAIQQSPDDAYNLTIKGNTVAVVSDGSAVLGLGNIGARAAMPVMEGKAMLFKRFANIDAFPICLAEQKTADIVKIVKALEPTFGGINLEDIAAPRCFEIEKQLQDELDIPVFHDDQHGTAVVCTAALINTLKLIGKKAKDLKVVILGAGAAGTACAKMIAELGVPNIIACDRKGAIHKARTDLTPEKLWLAEHTNTQQLRGDLSQVIRGADVFLGVSGPGLLSLENLKLMAKDAVVFAMANPIPEIMPEEALPHVAVMATGRSDYANQINNVLCFPGIFRGALDSKAKCISEDMKMAAAIAIAHTIEEEELQPEYIIPSCFDLRVVKNVSQAVARASSKVST